MLCPGGIGSLLAVRDHPVVVRLPMLNRDTRLAYGAVSAYGALRGCGAVRTWCIGAVRACILNAPCSGTNIIVPKH